MCGISPTTHLDPVSTDNLSGMIFAKENAFGIVMKS